MAGSYLVKYLYLVFMWHAKTSLISVDILFNFEMKRKEKKLIHLRKGKKEKNV